MTDQSDGAWFQVKRRRWGSGYNFVPVTWQGWVMALGLGPAIVATVFAGDPTISRRGNIHGFLKIKAMLGLGAVHFPPVTVAAMVIGEIALFLVLLFWKSRTLKPLD